MDNFQGYFTLNVSFAFLSSSRQPHTSAARRHKSAAISSAIEFTFGLLTAQAS
jgi:hypothetical protein